MIRLALTLIIACVLYVDSLSVARSLIVNGKGGGHVAIGYHLAKELNSKGHEVTILQNCDVDNNKVPFSSYSSLDAEIVTMPFDDDFEYPFKAQFDFVFDNNSKSPDGPVESALLAAKPAKQRYTFVGSAGIYEKPSSHPHNIPLDESMPTNGEKGAAQFEAALTSTDIPHIIFRCQYIYGPLCPKHYLDYYTYRINNNLPVPIPAPGTQLVSLTDVRDVAEQLGKVVDALPPSGSIFNTGTFNDLKHNYIDVANLIGKGLGKTPEVKLYDPDVKTDFPFRAKEFFVKSGKSVKELSFSGGSQTLEGFLGELVSSFESRSPNIDTSKDAGVLKAGV
ncbi:hypothetical protein TrCOL_g12716 [Triparma columacea]|uniref:NAD-dependent epimerase/dehydratase domain-containing protein n=1 Tax=Triparma columacea TaxID=722753 RepID=A0A9W7GDF8_9STRA|nr:hypothetical protein TrCOL_g12716 [Triparma columacea]